VRVIRSIRPTDLVALVTFETKAFPNEAKTRDRLAQEPTRPLAVGDILEQWITLDNRQTLVVAEGLTIRSLVSARHRAGRSALEVDWLVPGQEEESGELSSDMLTQLSESGGLAGARRIFLRMPKESPLLSAAHRAGFLVYGAETLFRRDSATSFETPPELAGLRPREKGDDVGIFRLYHAAVPQSVRVAEGMTFEEWDEARDAGAGQQREYVYLREDHLQAWLRVTKRSGYGQFQLLVHPRHEEALSPLLHYALSSLGKHEAIFALIPDFQGRLQLLLTESWGFGEMARYNTLVRHLTVRVPEAKLVPARA